MTGVTIRVVKCIWICVDCHGWNVMFVSFFVSIVKKKKKKKIVNGEKIFLLLVVIF